MGIFIALVTILFGCNRGFSNQSFPPQTVEVMPLMNEIHYEKITIPCSVFDSGAIKISFPVGGTIKFLEQEGVVKSGTTLVELINDDLIALKESVKKELNFNKTVLDRFTLLLEMGGVSKTEFEKQGTIVKTLEGKLAQLDKSLSDTIFKAPEDGILGPWQVRVGEVISPNQEIGLLKIKGTAYIDCKLPADYAFILSTNPFKSHYENSELELVTAKPSINHESDTIFLRFKSDLDLGNNQTVPVTFIIERQDIKGYFVPIEAVKFDFDGPKIFVVKEADKNFQAKSHPVIVEEIFGDKVKINADLEEGTLIISKGISKIFSGVNIIF